jgi:AraC-type DNA-binding domain-containing proteins
MDLDLQELASVAGSSPFHFSRTFRAATGLPPYRFLIQRRIEFAKTLLVDRDLPIETIAANCGFHSRSQFAAMFRRALGINPARYRREH